MISFLRKIRRNFFAAKSLTGYLAYALSEIVLVVIGILIAVTINNWNEERKQKDELDKIYTIILEDLKNDMKDIDELIEGYEIEEPYYDLLMGDSLDDKELMACDVCPLLVSRYVTFNIEQRGYKLLQEYNGNAALPEDSLIVEINQFYAGHIKFIDQVEQYIQGEVADNLNDWKKNYSWYSSMVYSNRYEEGFWKYMRTSDYKNKLSHHYLLIYSNYIPYIKSFEHYGGTLADKLTKKLSDQE